MTAGRLRILPLFLLITLAGCAALSPLIPPGGETLPVSAPDGSYGSDPGLPQMEPSDPGLEPSFPAPEHPVAEAHIIAVGDLLMHTPLVYSSALSDGGFDFTPLFAAVRPWIEDADVAIANLETTLTGTAYPWSGYPSFNTPQEFAKDLKRVGFDVITHANNHSLDYFEYGLLQTITALERHGLARTGANRSAEEQEQILVVPVGPEIKMAVLAYTYGTNGIPLPHSYSVNLLDAEQIKADIRRARALPDVDLVAIALHMGDEYARIPNESQEEYIRISLEAGADIILGSHPHVLQPIEMRQVTDQHGRDLPRVVSFSLGNFISNQIGMPREAGLILQIDVSKQSGVTRIESVSFLPTWVHPYAVHDAQRYRVVPVESAMRRYEQKADPLITEAQYLRLQEVWADTTVQAVGSPDVKLQRVETEEEE